MTGGNTMELPYMPVTSNKNGAVQQRSQITKRNRLKQFSLPLLTEHQTKAHRGQVGGTAAAV